MDLKLIGGRIKGLQAELLSVRRKSKELRDKKDKLTKSGKVEKIYDQIKSLGMRGLTLAGIRNTIIMADLKRCCLRTR
jgi:hypothetical protein